MYLVEKYGDSSPEDVMIEAEFTSAIDHALTTLRPQYEKVIRARFGIDSGTPRTYQSIADEFGISSARVPQIIASGLRRLRHPHRLTPVLNAFRGNVAKRDADYRFYAGNVHHQLRKIVRKLHKELLNEQFLLRHELGSRELKDVQLMVSAYRAEFRQWRDRYDDLPDCFKMKEAKP